MVSNVNTTLLLPPPQPRQDRNANVRFDLAAQDASSNGKSRDLVKFIDRDISAYAADTYSDSDLIFSVESYSLTGQPGGLTANSAGPIRGALYDAIV